MDAAFLDELKRIDRMMREKGVFLHEETGRSYYTGYEYATLYDWDQYFETIVQLYLGWSTQLARNGIMIFCDLQKDSGHIQRSSKGCAEQLSEHVKPFLFQICLLVYNRDGDVSFLTDNDFFYYKRLQKYLAYWLDAPGNYDGLAFWDSAPHTGMDNQRERAGNWHERDKFCCGVDLNSYLVRECLAASEIAAVIGDDDYAAYIRGRSGKIRQSMLRHMWNAEDGFFYDIDRESGKQIKVRYIGAFAAMWAGVADNDMAASMVERYLKSSSEFDRGFIYPALSSSEPGYTENYLPGDLGCNWRANTWIPTNYYVFESLRRYGYSAEASRLADVTYRTVKEAGEREYYATESRTGCGLYPFWGWSLLSYFMPYEIESGYDPTEIRAAKNDRILL